MSGWLEQAWLARYLDRQLQSNEVAWFEAYVLDKPELLAMIDADTHLRDAVSSTLAPVHADTAQGYSAGGASSATDAAANPESLSGNKRVRPFPHRTPLRSWLAVAAALALGLGIGGIGVRSLAPDRSDDVVGSPTRIVYDTLRGEVASPHIENGDSQSSDVLVEVAVPPGAADIFLQLPERNELALVPSPDSYVSFILSRKYLGTQHNAIIRYHLGDSLHQKNIILPN